MQAEAKAGEIAETFRASGLTPDKWDDFLKSEADVKKYLNIIESSKPKGPTILGHPVIDATSSRGKEITRDLFNMLDRQSGKNVIKTDFGKPFAEEVGSVDGTIKYLKTLEPMDSMKEANKVLKGEGRYKSLSKADRKKIVDDESVTDHIFERNIDPDPEDFAYGGVAGMLGERTGYNEGKTAKKSFIKLIPQYDEKGNLIPVFSKTGKQQIEGAPEGITSDKEVFNLIVGLDIPITEKINILGDIGFSKYRDRIEKDDQELFLMDPASNVNKNIGIGYEDNGLSGSIMYNPDTKYKQFQISKKFNEGGRVPYSKGSSSEVLPADFDELNYDELMHIIKLLQAGEIPQYASGGRIGFSEGRGPKMSRRNFLKIMGGLAALPVVGKLFKFTKPLAKTAKVADLTSVPINNVAGMPAWFKPLVNKVIKEGDDVTKKLATKEREIVHTKKLDEFDEVTVTQDLDTGNVRVEYQGSTNMGEAPIQLDYKAGEMLEGPIKKGQPSKTKSEFSAVESEPEIVNWDGDIEWSGENVVNKVDDLLTDTTKLETYATGKKPNIKKLLKSEQKQKYVNKLHDDQMEQINFIENKHGPGPDPTDFFDEKDLGKDFASGGRVPMWMGGGLGKGKELLRNMVKYFAKESTIGKTPSEYLKISNPKQYKKMLNDLSIYKKYSPGEGIMAPQMIKDMIKKTEVDRQGVIEQLISSARHIKKADESAAAYKKQIVDSMVEKGADKEMAEMFADSMSKAIDIKGTPKITEEGLLELETIYK
ncbi:MAG: hypothetical protein H8E12_02975, partial [Rhodobacteraceae bacterium]|nr:hypothetical protein [Paracoccaceae bacterium]